MATASWTLTLEMPVEDVTLTAHWGAHLENCIAYMNSDCGGHTGNPDKEQFIRWMQYGTLSPVFRPHCTNSERYREPWLYDEETLNIVREYNLLRYRLLLYLYANAHEAYETGIPMFHSLALEYPKDRHAAACRNEYLLGKDLLIAPLCGAVPRRLSEKNYTAPVEVEFYRGRAWEGEPVARAVWKSVYMDLRHESPMEGVPVYNFSAKLKTKIVLDAAERLYIRNDDGATVYLDGKCVLKDENTHSPTLNALADLAPGVEHTLEIDYFQAEGEAFLGLFTAEAEGGNAREVYLPAGRWLDLFDGTVYAGRRVIEKEYGLRSMPLFVRLGSLIPLIGAAQNTKAQDPSELVFDFYPSKTGADEGYLYEDDGETTAYKLGAYRKIWYSAQYLPETHTYAVRLKAAEGYLAGAIARRRITVKYHLIKGAGRVARVYVNGAEVPFEQRRRSDEFPLHTELSAPDADIVTVTFSADAEKDSEVKFVLKSNGR